ncbi:MAG: GGDEF domain-containing protein [Dokdonella sp.]
MKWFRRGEHTGGMGIALRTLLLWLVLATCWCCACAGTLASTPTGDPLLQRFTPADFKATPYLYSIAGDSEGRIYIGNNDGVLRLQGREWETIPLPGGMSGGSLARGRDGLVYLSGYDSFGSINTAPDGSAVYHDLRDAFGLKGADRALGWMAEVIPVDDGVYFRAQRRLLFYSFKGSHQQWPLAEKEGSLNAWHGDLYNLDLEWGLRRFDNGRLLPVAGGAVMRGHRGVELIDQGDSALLLSVGGFYRLRGGRVTALDVPPIPSNAGIFAKMLTLPDGGFVVGTSTGDLLEYDAGAHLQSRHKIARTSIVGLYYDADHGLWAVSEDELVRLQLPSPWSRIDMSDLGGVIGDCELHNGALWLAVGSLGLVRMSDANGERQIEWIAAEHRQQIFGLVSTADGLLVAQGEGIDVIADDGKMTQLVHHEQPVYSIVLSHYDHDLAYAPGDEGVYVLRRRDHKWALAALLPAPELASQTVIETAPGVLWVNNTRGLPERWQIDTTHARLLKRERFALKTPARTVDPNQAAQVYAFADAVYVGLGANAYRFDGHAFVPYKGAPFSLMQNPNAFQILQAPIGTFAYTGSRLYRQNNDGPWKREDFGAQPQASQSVLRYGSDGVLRLSVWRALLEYRPTDKPALPMPPLALRLTGVTQTFADGHAENLSVTTSPTDAFEQGQTLSLHFAVFTAEPGVEYRYRAPGILDNYTEWREQPTVTFSGLSERGEHEVEVQARTPSGRPVTSLQYAFTIAPRWYQITLVRLLMVLAVLIALLLLIRWRERRQAHLFVERQQKLEAKIAERTVELEVANRKLEELATEDGLTGVANRRALESGLQREWRRCCDQRTSIALLMIDVDRFKQYNDQHGHVAGDAVLKQVAERLKVGLEPQRELLARYGGEEFCLLLPGVALDAAHRRAEQLRQSFNASDSSVTVSIGVAARVPNVDDSPEALLRAADQMLYEAKRRGRNRVEVGTE